MTTQKTDKWKIPFDNQVIEKNKEFKKPIKAPV
jgi:hypothetical protein